jgi:lactoylglutathione lyase
VTEPTGRELRLVLTTADFNRAVHLYRDVLGLPEVTRFPSPGRNVLLDAGRATIELADETHAADVDALEVGRRVAGPVRLAVRVADVAPLTDAAAGAGAAVLAGPSETPWGATSARIADPDGLQLTLFGPSPDDPPPGPPGPTG